MKAADEYGAAVAYVACEAPIAAKRLAQRIMQRIRSLRKFPDRGGFLQGLVSNDVDKIAADRAVYAAFLTAQGKYLHDFIMAAAGEAIWLDCEAARLADLKRRLSIYRLRAKVAIDELPDLAVAAVFAKDPVTIDTRSSS